MVDTRRQQIDDVASALFRERGYAATSVREIARGVDLQGASLYAHVASKEALLWSIVWRVAERFRLAADAALASPGPSAARLAVLIRAHVEIVAGEREDAAVFLQDWRFLDEPHRVEIAARREAYEAVLRGLLVEGVRDGSLRSLDGPADAAVTGRAILAALNGISAWYHPDGALDTAAVADAYLSIFMRGLQAMVMPTTEEAQP
ncbi:MAG: TetR/AcrR family transcriptional regulator [Candidatus Limnocylindrales bacterium]